MVITGDRQGNEDVDDITAITDHVDHLEQLIRRGRNGVGNSVVGPEDLIRAADRLTALARLVPTGGRAAAAGPPASGPRVPAEGTPEAVADQIWHHIRAIERLQRMVRPSGVASPFPPARR